eukprot:403350635
MDQTKNQNTRPLLKNVVCQRLQHSIITGKSSSIIRGNSYRNNHHQQQVENGGDNNRNASNISSLNYGSALQQRKISLKLPSTNQKDQSANQSLTTRKHNQSIVNLKKKDEFSGDFFKNIMTERGGNIIKNLRLNSIGSSTKVKNTNTDRLTDILQKKNLISNNANQQSQSLTKSPSSQIVPFLFNMRKEVTNATVNFTSAIIGSQNQNSFLNNAQTSRSQVNDLSQTLPAKLSLFKPQNQQTETANNSVNLDTSALLNNQNTYFLTQPKASHTHNNSIHSIQNENDLKSQNQQYKGFAKELCGNCNYCQHCKCREQMDPNEYLFLEDYSLSSLIQKSLKGNKSNVNLNEISSNLGYVSGHNIQQEYQQKLKEKMTSDRFIDDLITNKKSIKELIHEETLEALLNHKLYKGQIELKSQEFKELLGELDYDDLGIKFMSELQDGNQAKEEISDQEYLQLISQNFKENLAQLLKQKQGNFENSNDEKLQDQSVLQQLINKKIKHFIYDKISSSQNHQQQQSSINHKNQASSKILLPDMKLNLDYYSKYRSLALYISIQDVIRQLSQAATQSINQSQYLQQNHSQFHQQNEYQNDFGRDRGHLLVRLINEYFIENEKKWFGVVQKIAAYNQVLKQDRELLMGKYEREISVDIKNVLENPSDSFENLIQHKTIIKTLLGKLNNEEDLRLKQELKLVDMKAQIDKILFESEKLLEDRELTDKMLKFHNNSQVQIGQQARLNDQSYTSFKNTQEIWEYYTKQAQDKFNPISLNSNSQNQSLKQQQPQSTIPQNLDLEITLMVNSERLQKMVTSLKSKTQLEFEQIDKKQATIKDERNRFKSLSKHYEKLFYDAMEKIREQEREMKNLINFLKNGNQDSKFWQDYFKDNENNGTTQQADQGINQLMQQQQQLKDATENLLTVTSADGGDMPTETTNRQKQKAQQQQLQSLKKNQRFLEDRTTIYSLINKVKSTSYYEPISKDQVIEFIIHIYSKKAQEMSLKIVQKDSGDLEFEDTIFQFFKQRFQGQEKCQVQCLEFLLGLKSYSNKDERIETFIQFLPALEQLSPHQQLLAQKQESMNSNQFNQILNKQDSSNVMTPLPRKYQRDILELYVKLMKCTDASINQIMQSSANQSTNQLNQPTQLILIQNQAPIYTAKYYFERTERNVIFNASVQIKTQLMRNLIYESDIYIDGKRVAASSLKNEMNNLAVRFELYILMEFYKSTEAVDIQHFAQILEKKCKTTNEYGMANYDEFQKVFFTYLSYWDQLLDIRKFLNVALKITVMFYQEAKFFYNRIFQQVDTEKKGLIEFHQFQQLIRKIKPDLPQWKIFAIFQSSSNQDRVEVGMVSFPQFLRSCLNHSLMEGLMNIDFSSIKDQDNDTDSGGKNSGLQRHDTFKKSPNIRDIKNGNSAMNNGGNTTQNRRNTQSVSPTFRQKLQNSNAKGNNNFEKIKVLQL